MVEDVDVLENNSDSVTEDELKKAFHSLVLYMGEQDMWDLNSQIRLPNPGGNDMFVDLEIHIANVGELTNE